MRALVHVQHLLGTGHFVRAAAIARALALRGVETILVTGNAPPSTHACEGAALVALPSVRSADASFRTLIGPDGRPVDDALWRERRERLVALAAAHRPDILVTETFPFGRKPFAAELLPLLEAVRHARPAAVVAASIRDILVRKDDPAKERAMAERARALYDLVLVHADPALLRLADSFPFADAIADRVRYTGFVHEAAPAEAPPGEGVGEAIVSAGGGAVGRALFEAAIDARARSERLAALPFRLLVSGAHGEETRAALAEHAARAAPDGGIRVEATRPDFPSLLARARLSVSQCGYNTALDVLAAGPAAVFVPFADGAETEQSQRAALLAAHGRATVCPPDRLSAGTLANAAEAALDLAPAPMTVATDGAARAADILLAAARDRGADPHALGGTGTARAAPRADAAAAPDRPRPAPDGATPAGDHDRRAGAATIRAETAIVVRMLLDRAATGGRRVSLWWRDDDATAPGPALDRLIALARGHGVPLSLAVIPAPAEPALAETVHAAERVFVLQHGYAHANHEPADAKAAELGDARPADTVLAELATGRARLSTLFGTRFLPVLAPPWNRAAPAVLARAPAAGYAGVSLYGRRGGAPARVDTHLDPIAWRQGRGFAGIAGTLAPLAAAIAAAEMTGAATVGPLGLLSHHLVQDEETWAFVEGFASAAAAHAAADWPDPRTLFGLA